MPATEFSEPSNMKPANFGLFLLTNLLVSLLVGYLLDYWTGWKPLFLILAVLYAVIGSFVILLYRDKKKQNG